MSSIEQVYKEGRLIRNSWALIDEQGRELLCLYTALAGDAKARPGNCPAYLAPKWLAYLLPSWDDCGSEEAWSTMVKRVVKLAPMFGELQGEKSRRALAGCMLVSLDVASRSDKNGVYDTVSALWRRVQSGDEPTRDEWRAAWRTAESAAWSVAESAAWSVADRAAWRAARNAAWSVARSVARSASWNAAWDEITSRMLDVIEEELG